MNCYRFSEAENVGNGNVKRTCELLQVSRAAYYADRTAGASRRQQRDVELTDKIVEIHDSSKHTYGSPRVHHELRARGERCSRKRVARLMRAADRHGRQPKRWTKTTIPDPAATTRPDLIGRDFAVDLARPEAVNTRWCGDITYVHTGEGWLYLATVIAWRRVGWSAGRSPITCAPIWSPMPLSMR